MKQTARDAYGHVLVIAMPMRGCGLPVATCLACLLAQARLIDRIQTIEFGRGNTCLTGHEAIGTCGRVTHKHANAPHLHHIVGREFLSKALDILGTGCLSLLMSNVERGCERLHEERFSLMPTVGGKGYITHGRQEEFLLLHPSAGSLTYAESAPLGYSNSVMLQQEIFYVSGYVCHYADSVLLSGCERCHAGLTRASCHFFSSLSFSASTFLIFSATSGRILYLLLSPFTTSLVMSYFGLAMSRFSPAFTIT